MSSSSAFRLRRRSCSSDCRSSRVWKRDCRVERKAVALKDGERNWLRSRGLGKGRAVSESEESEEGEAGELGSG